MENEVRKLRVTLARREGGRGRRFVPELRRQISAAGRQMSDEGQNWFRVGGEIGLPGETVVDRRERRVYRLHAGLIWPTPES